ncbi:MAG: hypothetical protein AAB289_02770, partial [Chloroflexota bacterium]
MVIANNLADRLTGNGDLENFGNPFLNLLAKSPAPGKSRILRQNIITDLRGYCYWGCAAFQ